MEATPESMGEKTPMGTQIRGFWTAKYKREVQNIEKDLQRPICAAPKDDGLPCRSFAKDKYFWYCYSHRPKAEDQKRALTDVVPYNNEESSTTGVTQIGNNKDIKIMSREMLIETFRQCNNCQLRGRCERFLSDQHCVIQEDEFIDFIDTMRDDYDLRKVDMYIVYRAGQSFAASQYLLMAQNQVNVFSDEAKNLRVATVRESKEFRECLKDLGVTRGERMRNMERRKSLAIQGVKAGAEVTIAQLMAKLAKRTLQQEQQERELSVIESQDVDDE